MSADTTVSGGTDPSAVREGMKESVDELKELRDLTEKNIKATTDANNKMIKLTTVIKWLTYIISFFTLMQIFMNFKPTKEIAVFTLTLWKTIIIVGLGVSFAGLVCMVYSKFTKINGGEAESVGGAGRPRLLTVGWVLTITGFLLQILGTLMAP